jgi:thioredoxin-related protein
MQRVFLSFLLSCFMLFSPAQEVATAESILNAATQKASKENKNVIVIFHASWCIWCRKMDASLNDPSVKKYFENNYVIIHLVVKESKEKKHLENPGAETFLEKMGGKEEGLPYWVVLDKKGSKLADSQMNPGENTGCPASEKEVAYFIAVLQKTSTLKQDELDLIAKRFRKNE